ncbi:hypothetical protein AKO1_010351 [Acrasis kona]|uniref:D-2-hydroxyacid dehydrogenase n=1 Tax=Acrasis kona TaxID=1008807 RepID=A0AAW2YQE6_9EUKA
MKVALCVKWFNVDELLVPMFRKYEQEHGIEPLEFVRCTSLEDVRNEVLSNKTKILFIDPPSSTIELWKFVTSKESTIEWVHSSAAGVDKFFATFKQLPEDNLTFLQNEIKFTRRAGSVTPQTMTEYILMIILNMERSMKSLSQNSLNHEWQSDYNCRLLSECRVGLMGYGEIGREIANKLNSNFNMKINVLKRGEASNDSSVDKWFSSTSEGGVEKFLSSDLDYIVAILPSTKETVGLLNNSILKNCERSKPVFINLGRGDLVGDQDIVTALENKWIRFAALDVLSQEPLPKDSILWGRQDLLVTPHCSCKTKSIVTEIAKGFYENMNLFKNNQQMVNLVDWKKEY